MDYRIKSGDTLWALSRRFDTTVDKIVAANKGTIKDPDRIFAGDTITIPERARDAAQAAREVQAGGGDAKAEVADRPQPARDAATAARHVAPDAPRPASLMVAPTSTSYVAPQGPTPTYAAPTYVAPEPATYVAPQVSTATTTGSSQPATSVAAARSSYEDHPFEQRVLDLVNQVRASYGLGPLAWNAALDSEAEAHVVHMSRVDRMAHDSIGDGTPAQRMRAHGWTRAWGENVAVGQTSPEQVVREWMASPGHRANILNPNFSYLSVAYGTNAHGRPYWGQAFGA